MTPNADTVFHGWVEDSDHGLHSRAGWVGLGIGLASRLRQHAVSVDELVGPV